jgi:hypothetical protein
VVKIPIDTPFLFASPKDSSISNFWIRIQKKALGMEITIYKPEKAQGQKLHR